MVQLGGPTPDPHPHSDPNIIWLMSVPEADQTPDPKTIPGPPDPPTVPTLPTLPTALPSVPDAPPNSASTPGSNPDPGPRVDPKPQAPTGGHICYGLGPHSIPELDPLAPRSWLG